MAYQFSVFLHIVCASFWIGGMLFLPLVVLPGIKDHPDKVEILYKTGMRFRTLGWITLILLLITGLGNAWLRGLPVSFSFFFEEGYGKWMGIKILFFAIMLAISGVHDFFIGGKAIEGMRRGEGGRFRQVARWSGRLNLLISLILAFIGIMLSRGMY